MQYHLCIYEACLKSNGTVHAARIAFMAEKKALLFMMSQCLMISKTKSQHSATTTVFFCQGIFFVTVFENLINLRMFGFFFFGAKDERRTTYQPKISSLSWKNSN